MGRGTKRYILDDERTIRDELIAEERNGKRMLVPERRGRCYGSIKMVKLER